MNRLTGDAEIAVRLVEVSRTLAETQAQTLGVQMTSPTGSQSDCEERLTSPTDSQSRSDEQLTATAGQSRSSESRTHSASGESEDSVEQTSLSASQWEQLSGTTACGRSVTWHDRLGDVPEEFSLIVANEFFDTMPVHQFRVR